MIDTITNSLIDVRDGLNNIVVFNYGGTNVRLTREYSYYHREHYFMPSPDELSCPLQSRITLLSDIAKFRPYLGISEDRLCDIGVDLNKVFNRGYFPLTLEESEEYKAVVISNRLVLTYNDRKQFILYGDPNRIQYRSFYERFLSDYEAKRIYFSVGENTDFCFLREGMVMNYKNEYLMVLAVDSEVIRRKLRRSQDDTQVSYQEMILILTDEFYDNPAYKNLIRHIEKNLVPVVRSLGIPILRISSNEVVKMAFGFEMPKVVKNPEFFRNIDGNARQLLISNAEQS